MVHLSACPLLLQIFRFPIAEKMSRKHLLTASIDWLDPEVGLGLHPPTQPHPVPAATDDSPEWKACLRIAREQFFRKEAYDSHAWTPTKQWWENPEGVCLQQFSLAPLLLLFHWHSLHKSVKEIKVFWFALLGLCSVSLGVFDIENFDRFS